MKLFRLVLPLLTVSVVSAAVPQSSGEVTITSDALEFLDQGARTRFVGNVRLSQPTQELVANQMTRWRSTGIVEARGQIRGTYRQADGSTLIARSEIARYTPKPKKVEWWDQAQVERWRVATDTAPLRATASRFSYEPELERLTATTNVTLGQPPQWTATSDLAVLEASQKKLVMSGSRGATLDVDDVKLKATFQSDQLIVTDSPAVLSLVGQVKGTVTPR